MVAWQVERPAAVTCWQLEGWPREVDDQVDLLDVVVVWKDVLAREVDLKRSSFGSPLKDESVAFLLTDDIAGRDAHCGELLEGSPGRTHRGTVAHAVGR